MSVRKDTAQLIIDIDTKESQAYANTVADSKTLVNNLKKAEQGGEEYNKILKEIIGTNKTLQGVDFAKLTGKNIKARRKQLFQLRDTLTQTAFAELGFEKELKDVNKALQEQGERTRNTSKSMGIFQKSLLPLGAVIAATFAVDRILDFFGALFTGSAQMEAVNRRFETVFGSSQDLIEGWAETTANSLGLTVEEYKKVTAASGDLLIPMGFQREEAALISREITGASAALAIWEGGQRSTSDITKILNKAILGEREQLTELGVKISEADVKTRLAANGAAKLTGEALKQAKATATLQLITESSADAIKGFSDNTEDAAQKKARLTARIGEQVDLIKKGLLPAYNLFLDVGGFFVDLLVNSIRTLATIPKFIKENEDALVLLTVSVLSFNSANIAAAASTLSLVAAQKLSVIWAKRSAVSFKALNLVMKANPVGFVVGLIASMALGLQQLYKRSQTVRAGISGFFTALKAGFSQIVRGAKIFAKELDLAISIKPSTRKRLREEIKALKDEADEAAKSGKTVGAAFSKGYNDKIKEEAAAAVAEEEKRRALEAAEKRARENQLAKLAAEEKLAEEKRQRDIATKERLAAEKAESDRIAKIKAKRANDNIGPIEAIDTIAPGGVSSKPESLKELATERLKNLQESSDREFTQLEINAIRSLTAEEIYEQQRLDKLVEFNEQRLGILEAAGLKDTAIYEKIELEKLRIEKERQQKSIENEQRTAKMKRELEIAQREATADTFSQFAELLSQDESARKKNAGAIKTFKSAEVIVSGINEVSRIREQAATLGPIFGPILGAIQTGLAIARTTVSLNKIKSAKFEKGVRLTDGAIFRGALHSQGGIPFSHGEAEDGEIIINRRSSSIFRDQLEAINTYNGYGRKFADGGPISAPPSIAPVGITPSVVSNNDEELKNVLNQVAQALRQFPREAIVSLGRIQEKTNIENTLEKLSEF